MGEEVKAFIELKEKAYRDSMPFDFNKVVPVEDDNGRIIGTKTPYGDYVGDFDNDGVLVGIKDPFGNYITVQYMSEEEVRSIEEAGYLDAAWGE